MKEKKGITIYLNKDNNIEKNITKLRKILVDLQNRKELILSKNAMQLLNIK